MANTAWSTTDKTAGITLSGSNLIATTTLSTQGIRSADKQITGKFYFEITVTTTFGQSNTGVGSSAAALNNANALATCSLYHNNGGVFLNNVSSGVSFGSAISNGTVVCIALDVTNQLIWFRLGAAGNWNANATFSPGGTGASTSLRCSVPVSRFMLMRSLSLTVRLSPPTSATPRSPAPCRAASRPASPQGHRQLPTPSPRRQPSNIG